MDAFFTLFVRHHFFKHGIPLDQSRKHRGTMWNITKVLALAAVEYELMRVLQLALGRGPQPIIQGLLLEVIDPDTAIWKRFADDRIAQELTGYLLSESVSITTYTAR